MGIFLEYKKFSGCSENDVNIGWKSVIYKKVAKSKDDCMKECTEIKECKFFIHDVVIGAILQYCYLGDFQAANPLKPDELTDLKTNIDIFVKDSKYL